MSKPILGCNQRGINFVVVDHDFIETLGIKMVNGRDFQQDMPSDTINSVVVNETFVNRMAWSDPIGKKVELGDGSFIRARVIGVMADYHQTGMYNEIESLILVYRALGNIIYVKLSGNNMDQTLSFIENKWKEVFPDQPYSYTFLSERFNRQFEADKKRGLIFTMFTILAILIACLGLFGLASYMVEQRTKEIGIRKSFGADELVILRLDIKGFSFTGNHCDTHCFTCSILFYEQMAPKLYLQDGHRSIPDNFRSITYHPYHLYYN